MGGQDVIKILKSLPKLKELSLDINPCSSDAGFNYEVLLTLDKLKMFNDEAVRELDRDVAKQFFRIQGLPVPDEQKPNSTLVSKDHALHDKENISKLPGETERRKSVRFKVPGENDNSNDWQQTEIKRLQR
jgi:hypothetical protein